MLCVRVPPALTGLLHATPHSPWWQLKAKELRERRKKGNTTIAATAIDMIMFRVFPPAWLKKILTYLNGFIYHDAHGNNNGRAGEGWFCIRNREVEEVSHLITCFAFVKKINKLKRKLHWICNPFERGDVTSERRREKARTTMKAHLKAYSNSYSETSNHAHTHTRVIIFRSGSSSPCKVITM